MTRLDLTPLYRSSIGFDRMGSLLDTALRSEKTSAGYPPYDIEVRGDNQYAITLAIAGFEKGELSQDINAWLELIDPQDRHKLSNAVEYHRQSTTPIK